MDILDVVELNDVPDVPAAYTPSRWVLSVAAELERRMKLGQKLVLVKLYDPPKYRTVGPESD